MVPFRFTAAQSADVVPKRVGRASGDDRSSVAYLAGGTTVVDLMKLNVLTPASLVSVEPILSDEVTFADGTLSVGAGCTMADLADHRAVRERFPALRHSLLLAASPQIRNMATVGGNLLQRTRCPYFRHTDMRCNKREPGTGCGALEPRADRHLLAVLGVSDHCIANYPGDMAVAMAALDAVVHLTGADGDRTVPLRDFHKLPGDTPHVETVLKPGELITRVSIPASPVARNSWYLKVRERSSYAFALAGAAVGLELDGVAVGDCRIALGGMATKPWASEAAEDALRGKLATDDMFEVAANAALADADPPAGLEWKVTLAKRTVVRALKHLRDHGVPGDAELWAMQHGRPA